MFGSLRKIRSAGNWSKRTSLRKKTLFFTFSQFQVRAVITFGSLASVTRTELSVDSSLKARYHP